MFRRLKMRIDDSGQEMSSLAKKSRVCREMLFKNDKSINKISSLNDVNIVDQWPKMIIYVPIRTLNDENRAPR